MTRSRQDTVRKPKQERSQQRVDLILDAARRLIAERGSSGLTVSDLAKVAGISAASVYQYFPNKAAILADLAERSFALIGARLTEQLAVRPKDYAEAGERLIELVDAIFRMNLQDPVMRDILQGVVTDKTLWEISVDDTRHKVDQICAAIEPVVPAGRKADLRITVMLLTEFTEGAVRVALSMPALEARRTIDRLKAMLRAAWFADL